MKGHHAVPRRFAKLFSSRSIAMFIRMELECFIYAVVFRIVNCHSLCDLVFKLSRMSCIYIQHQYINNSILDGKFAFPLCLGMLIRWSRQLAVLGFPKQSISFICKILKKWRALRPHRPSVIKLFLLIEHYTISFRNRNGLLTDEYSTYTTMNQLTVEILKSPCSYL